MKKTFLILSFLLLISGIAFGQKRLLADTSWKLVEAERQAVTRSSASISFNGDATRFTGNTGCNSMSGSIAVRGMGVDFGPIASTRRMCKLMEGNVPEGTYTNALANAASFRRTGSVLRFYDRRGRKVLEFTRVIGGKNDERVGLEDRKWVLEQIKGRQTFVALPYAVLNFDAKKHSAGGNGGCNVFGSDYTASGSTITFKNIISTMRACVEDNKMAVERDMLDGLRVARRFEIRDDRLYLYRGSDLLLTFRGEDK